MKLATHSFVVFKLEAALDMTFDTQSMTPESSGRAKHFVLVLSRARVAVIPIYS
jgi:hypothetical protein